VLCWAARHCQLVTLEYKVFGEAVGKHLNLASRGSMGSEERPLLLMRRPPPQRDKKSSAGEAWLG